jgi:hypothetical protein
LKLQADFGGCGQARDLYLDRSPNSGIGVNHPFDSRSRGGS